MLEAVDPPLAAERLENLEFWVNGRRIRIALEPGANLLEVLRNDLGLTGSRFGCGLEQCGACMVLVDGRPRHACQVFAPEATGRHVFTIEGLHDDGAGQAVIAAMLQHQAGQCGYCLSGIVVTATAWLRELQHMPSRAEIAAVLDHHLCRCGAQPRIMAAIESAAAAFIAAGAA